MSHIESVSPSSRAPSGRVGIVLSMISGKTTGVANSPDVSLPAKTLGRVQASNERLMWHRA